MVQNNRLHCARNNTGITALSHIEIKKEAFLSITYSNNPLISFIGFVFLGLLYIASAIYFLLTRPHEYLFQDGFLPSEIVGLISGVCISSIAVANLISIYRQKKAKKEDDE
jgi:hypothetical protein